MPAYAYARPHVGSSMTLTLTRRLIDKRSFSSVIHPNHFRSLFRFVSLCVFNLMFSFFLFTWLPLCMWLFSFFVHKSKIVTFCFYVVYFINYPVVIIQTFCDVNLSVFYFQHSLSLQLCFASFSSFHFVVDT